MYVNKYFRYVPVPRVSEFRLTFMYIDNFYLYNVYCRMYHQKLPLETNITNQIRTGLKKEK